MKKFPMLYKKTNTGAIQQWSICVQLTNTNFGGIATTYGQKDGKLQVTCDVIKEGKNPGKKNATSPYEQAIKEATSTWKKKIKKGYTEDLSIAEAGDKSFDHFECMLAHGYTANLNKIVWPVIIQKKLDGIRILAIVIDGVATLYSRNGEVFKSLPHINKALEARFKTGTHYLDGEAYHHDFKDNFEKITSLVKSDEPQPGYGMVQYWIYDTKTSGSYEERQASVKGAIKGSLILRQLPHLFANNHEEVRVQCINWVREGYEGAMIKAKLGEYEGKRSLNLLKYKLFWNKKTQSWEEYQEDEFKIVGIKEGRGRLMGHVGTFLCMTKDGKQFGAKMKGDTAVLKQYFENHTLWEGKELSVKYLGCTRRGIPRFPVGKAIRDYE